MHLAAGYSGSAGDASAAQLVCGEHKSSSPITIDVDGIELRYDLNCRADGRVVLISLERPTDSSKGSAPKLLLDANNPNRIVVDQNGFAREKCAVSLAPVQSSPESVNDLTVRVISPPLGVLEINLSPARD
jgi:hypothetical protein